MRALLIVLTFVVLAVSSCAGDTSSLMSAWSDGGPAVPVGGQGGTAGGQGGQTQPPAGGQGGQTPPAAGGSGGGGGAVSGGTLVVPGGRRDLATAMCTVTSGNTCPVPAEYISCLLNNCNSSLTACYYSDGVSVAVGGVCQRFANCMLACPCDNGRQKCEDACTSNHATTNPECSTCLFNLLICSSRYGCTLPSTCSASSTGASGS